MDRAAALSPHSCLWSPLNCTREEGAPPTASLEYCTRRRECLLNNNHKPTVGNNNNKRDKTRTVVCNDQGHTHQMEKIATIPKVRATRSTKASAMLRPITAGLESPLELSTAVAQHLNSYGSKSTLSPHHYLYCL